MNKFVWLLLCGALGVAQVKTDAAAEIRAARVRSNRALRAHDMGEFRATLADDCVMIRGNGTLVPSRQAYLDVIGGDFRDANSVRYERITETVEVSDAAPLAAEHGRWTGTLPSGKVAYGGTYLAMWRGGSAGWKIRSELFVMLRCDDAASCAAYRK